MLVPALYVTGLGLALLVQRTDAFNGVLRAIFFMPQMVSLVVVALIWQMLLVDKIGVIARALSPIGLGGVSWLGDPSFALFAVVFVSVWFLMGFYMLIFLGGLQDIPREYYEAAKIDGAGPVSFLFITLPLLRPTSFFVLLVSLVTAVAGCSVRPDLRDDQGRAGELDLALDLLHLSAGVSLQRFRLCGGAGLDPRGDTARDDGADFLITRGGRFQYG